MRQTLACLLAAALLPAQTPLPVWAAVCAAGRPSPFSYRPGPVAGALTDSLNAYLSRRGSRLSEVLSVESQIKAAYLLESLQAEAAPEPAVGRQAPLTREEARAALAALDAALKDINWHDLHDARLRGQMLETLAASLPERRSAPSADTVAAAVALLRPALKPAVPGENPWDAVFDGMRARAAVTDSSPVEPALLVPRSDPHWRTVALDIMIAGSLNVSRTATLGRIYTASDAMTHDEVKDLAVNNFRRAAEFVLDNADALPLSLDTAITLNKILTQGGLVPEPVRGDPYYNGDDAFRSEVRQFYEWLSSQKGAAFAREHPVELAERLHYVISHFDEFIDSNGRTARLMADLVLIKAGLAPAFYMGIGDYFARGSVRSGVSPAQRLEYFRSVVAEGQRMMRNGVELRHRLMDPLSHLHIEESVARRIRGTVGHEAVPAAPEVRASVAEFIRLTEAREAQQAPLFKKFRDGLRALPVSFKSYTFAVSMLSGTSWGIGIIMSVYGIKQWGLVAGLAAQALSLALRIPGSLIGARVLKRLGADSRKIYIWTTVVQGLQLLSLPLGLWLFGAGSVGYLVVFMVGQAIYGLVYGSTYGMAEGQIMRRMLGSNSYRLETAGFVSTASREIFSLAFLFVVSPLLLLTVDADSAILVYAGLVLSTIPFFAAIRYVPEPAAAAPVAAAKPAPAPEPSLPKRDFLPYVASVFLNAVFYALVGVFALYAFGNEAMSALAMTAYVAGRAGVSLIAALCEMAAGPERILIGRAKALDWLSAKAAFALMVSVASTYLAFSTAGWAIPALAAALLMGITTAVNSVRWMASYQSRLPPERLGDLNAMLTSVGVGAALMPFVVVSAGRLLGASVTPILWVVTAATALALAVSVAVVCWPRRPKS